MFKSIRFFTVFFLFCCVFSHQKGHTQDAISNQVTDEFEEDLSSFGGLVILPRKKYPSGGNFSLGLRSTASLFNSDGGFGSGVGGQFRLQLTDRVNTEWFADLITTNLSNAGRRTDAHIGWSVMFYLTHPSKESTLKPYVLAGHCFDYTRINAFSNPFENKAAEMEERWSSAVQMGFGTHLNVSDRFDFSLSAQYMMHLGNDIHAHIEEDGGYPELEIEEHDGASIEGHLLVTLSVNYKIADLWKSRF